MKKWIIISGYLIIVTLFFLYYLFPSEAITSYLNSRLSESLPGFHLAVAQIKPGFPPGLKLISPILYRQDKELIGADRLKIRPRYMTLFSPTKSFVFDGSVYDGSINGNADIATSESVLSINLLLDNVAIGKIPVLTQLIPHTVTGNATGRIDYSNKPPYGNGKAEIAISDCQVDFKPSLFGMDHMKLNTIDAGIEVTDNQVKINKFEAKGPELSGKISGSMGLKSPIAQSNLNITGQITPKPALMKNLTGILPIDAIGEKNSGNEGIPFRISGTFENPGFSMK